MCWVLVLLTAVALVLNLTQQMQQSTVPLREIPIPDLAVALTRLGLGP